MAENKGNIYEVPNIAPTHLQKELFRSSQRELVSVLKRTALSVCRGKIPADYINSSFNSFKQGFLYREPSGAISGFCIWKRKKEQFNFEEDRTIMHILLICGRQKMGFGNRLFVDIDTYCAEERIDLVQLQPANDTLKTYYESHGFVLTDTYFNIMTKEHPLVLAARLRAGKTRRAKRRVESGKATKAEAGLEETDQ